MSQNGLEVKSAATSNALKTLNDNGFYIPANVDGYVQKPIVFKSFSKIIELLSEKIIPITD
jgi:hypothetical protein